MPIKGKGTTIYLDNDCIKKLNNLKIEFWWVQLQTNNDKLKHLMWFYEHYKNNNGNCDL